MEFNRFISLLQWLQSTELVCSIQTRFQLERTKNDGKIRIGNYWWHYTFLIGTYLGDELFYSIFIPFWLWNIDGYVERRMVFIWALTMYIGQTLKDIVQMPRPDYPAIQLNDKWCLEYGMPSTHAMVSITIPVSILYFTCHRYDYNITIAVLITVFWSLTICFSRLYMGMHTVLDIVIGVLLATVLLLILLPITNVIDTYLINGNWSPLLLILTTIVLITYYPHSGRWTPTRTDTTTILAVFNGIYIGSWLSLKTNLNDLEIMSTSKIVWPTTMTFIMIVIRTVTGLITMLILKSYLKVAIFGTVCRLSGQDGRQIEQSANSLENKQKTRLDLIVIYSTYVLVGFYIQFGCPLLFKLCHCDG